MIISFLVLGMFNAISGGPTSIVTPASRTVALVPQGNTVSVTGTIPTTTFIWPEAMDPYDVLDYAIDCTGLLQTDETILTYSVNLRSEATLLGLQILTNPPYALSLTGNIITIWLAINLSDQDNQAFRTTGALLPLEVNITTSLSPARKRQRTVAVRVKQQ
jgi:hypothetical protein